MISSFEFSSPLRVINNQHKSVENQLTGRHDGVTLNHEWDVCSSVKNEISSIELNCEAELSTVNFEKKTTLLKITTEKLVKTFSRGQVAKGDVFSLISLD